jgi:hypothetical protein
MASAGSPFSILDVPAASSRPGQLATLSSTGRGAIGVVSKCLSSYLVLKKALVGVAAAVLVLGRRLA